MLPLEDDRLDVAAAREDHVGPVRTSHGQTEIGKQPRESCRKDRNPENPLGEEALEKHPLEPDLTEPEPLGVYLGEPRKRDHEQQRDQDEDKSFWHLGDSSPPEG